MMVVYGRNLLATLPTTRLEGYYFSAVFDSLLTIFTSSFLIWRPSPTH